MLMVETLHNSYISAVDVVANGVGDLRLLGGREHRIERMALHRRQQSRRVAEAHEAAPDSKPEPDSRRAAFRARLRLSETLDEVVDGDVGGRAHEHLQKTISVHVLYVQSLR